MRKALSQEVETETGSRGENESQQKIKPGCACGDQAQRALELAIAFRNALAQDCSTGRNCWRRSTARTRAEAALTLIAPMIAPLSSKAGTASARMPSSSSSSLIA